MSALRLELTAGLVSHLGYLGQSNRCLGDSLEGVVELAEGSGNLRSGICRGLDKTGDISAGPGLPAGRDLDDLDLAGDLEGLALDAPEGRPAGLRGAGPLVGILTGINNLPGIASGF